MEQMTLGKLIQELLAIYNADPKNRYKKIIVADDEEGNGYHGMYYSPEADPDKVKDAINYSNGVYETDTEDPNELIILG